MNKLKILIVDDEKLALDLLIILCKELDYVAETVGFTDSVQALEYIKNNTIDIALLDIDMPIIDGITLAKEITKYNGKTNIIFTTAYQQYALQAYENDASGYLLKPISKEALQHQLENLRYSFTENKPFKCICFGNFEIYYKGAPLKFAYSKTKELLAYLIDHNGAICTNEQIMVNLWEDDDNHNEYLKKMKRDLTNAFEKIGYKDAIIQRRGNIAVDKKFFDCDLFKYLDYGDKTLLNGDYIEQYSWAEIHRAQIQFDNKGEN